mmetsp:Transcript_24222/g.59725  ORF Transcript_24222/g.59725 Transcript_24222/m.59725 type:complete len:297 (+) Transcript_24222:376-1266(+)
MNVSPKRRAVKYPRAPSATAAASSAQSTLIFTCPSAQKSASWPDGGHAPWRVPAFCATHSPAYTLWLRESTLPSSGRDVTYILSALTCPRKYSEANSCTCDSQLCGMESTRSLPKARQAARQTSGRNSLSPKEPKSSETIRSHAPCRASTLVGAVAGRGPALMHTAGCTQTRPSPAKCSRRKRTASGLTSTASRRTPWQPSLRAASSAIVTRRPCPAPRTSTRRPAASPSPRAPTSCRIAILIASRYKKYFDLSDSSSSYSSWLRGGWMCARLDEGGGTTPGSRARDSWHIRLAAA